MWYIYSKNLLDKFTFFSELGSSPSLYPVLVRIYEKCVEVHFRDMLHWYLSFCLIWTRKHRNRDISSFPVVSISRKLLCGVFIPWTYKNIHLVSIFWANLFAIGSLSCQIWIQNKKTEFTISSSLCDKVILWIQGVDFSLMCNNTHWVKKNFLVSSPDKKEEYLV